MKKHLFVILLILIYVSNNFAETQNVKKETRKLSPLLSIGLDNAIIKGNLSFGVALDLGVVLQEKHAITVSSIITLTEYHIIGWSLGYQYNVLHNNNKLNLYCGASAGVWFTGKVIPESTNPWGEVPDPYFLTAKYFGNISSKFEYGDKRIRPYITEQILIGKGITNNFQIGVSIYFNQKDKR